MPTWPVDLEGWLTPFRVAEQTFDLGEGLAVQNRTGGGEVIRSGGAARLWHGTLTIGRLRVDQVAAVEARLHALRGAGACFWLRDYRKPRVENIGAVLSYNNTTMNIVTLKGLAPALVIAPGDYIAFGYAGRRALHQVVSGKTVDGSGNTGNIEVVPPFRPGVALDLPVSVGNPPLKAVMVPGSLRMGQSRGIWHEGISFDWTQTLRETP